MPDVILIRPGWTDFDEQKRIQGSLDLPLNPRGQKQVAELIDTLHDITLEVIYAAPSEPACSTAEAIGAGLDVPVKELKGLRNLDQGLWQGLLLDDLRRKYPKVYKQWQESPETICPPGGETVSDALKRARKALIKPLKRKDSFAVVASEPLATLIRYAIQGSKPDVPGPMCVSGQTQLIEILHVDSDALSPNGSKQTSRRQNAEADVDAELAARGGTSR